MLQPGLGNAVFGVSSRIEGLGLSSSISSLRLGFQSKLGLRLRSDLALGLQGHSRCGPEIFGGLGTSLERIVTLTVSSSQQIRFISHSTIPFLSTNGGRSFIVTRLHNMLSINGISEVNLCNEIA
jgi:hypothetical protein